MGRLDDMKRAAANKPTPPIAQPIIRPPKSVSPKAGEPKRPVPDPPKPAKPTATSPKGAKPIKVEATGDYVTHVCNHRVGLPHYRAIKCPSCASAPRPKRNFGSAANKHADKRLPDGSAFAIDPFVAATDTTPAKWSGTLTVPGFPPFVGLNTGLWGLLRYLDRQYREEMRVVQDVAEVPADKPAE